LLLLVVGAAGQTVAEAVALVAQELEHLSR
jgi:hypothetical protein